MNAGIAKTALVTAGFPVRPLAGADAAKDVAGADFAAALEAAAGKTVQSLRASEQVAIRGIEGKADIQTVVDQVMAAERTLSAAMAIRNKLIAAWQDISHMQI